MTQTEKRVAALLKVLFYDHPGCKETQHATTPEQVAEMVMAVVNAPISGKNTEYIDIEPQEPEPVLLPDTQALLDGDLD